MDILADISKADLKNSLHPSTLAGKTKGDKVIWGLVILLSLISLLAVYSASSSLAYKSYKGNTQYYLFRQIAFIIAGILVIYFTHLVDYRRFSSIAPVLFALVIPLLIYTLFFGVRMNEGSRWIKLPIINLTIQTSDIAKLVLFIYLARLLSKRQAIITDFKKGFLPLIVPIFIICALIAPANLSTALLLGASCMMLLFIGTVQFKHILLVVFVALIPLAILVSSAVSQHKSTKGAAVTKPSNSLFARTQTWVNRIEHFMYDKKEANAPGMLQVNLAKTAIAKGGIFGVGPGNSTIRDYLPQAYNDFIYAIIIEEYGFLGALCIVFIYIVFLYRCIRLFKKCQYAFGSFLALGLSFTLVIQAVVNMAVTVNLFPVTGVTLPLISMGGSSFIFTCLAIGMVLSVSRNIEEEQKAISKEAA